MSLFNYSGSQAHHEWIAAREQQRLQLHQDCSAIDTETLRQEMYRMSPTDFWQAIAKWPREWLLDRLFYQQPSEPVLWLQPMI